LGEEGNILLRLGGLGDCPKCQVSPVAGGDRLLPLAKLVEFLGLDPRAVDARLEVDCPLPPAVIGADRPPEDSPLGLRRFVCRRVREAAPRWSRDREPMRQFERRAEVQGSTALRIDGDRQKPTPDFAVCDAALAVRLAGQVPGYLEPHPGPDRAVVV